MQNKLSLPLKIDIQSIPPSSDEISQMQLHLKNIKKRKIIHAVLSVVLITFTGFVIAHIFDDMRYMSINIIAFFYTLYVCDKAKPIENQLDALHPITKQDHPREYVKLAKLANDPDIKRYLSQIALLKRQPTVLEFEAIEEWVSKADIREAEKRFEALNPGNA